MTCAGCGRDNHPRRRYCGECGSNLQPICARCGFDNEAVDRFCGGCGEGLTTAARAAAPRLASPPAPAPVPTPPVAQGSADLDALTDVELTALMDESSAVAASNAKLPEGKVTQDDLDRLFETN